MECRVTDIDANGNPSNKTKRDSNEYLTGRIGRDNVVLVTTGVGKLKAGNAVHTLLASYTQIRLALVVGICGGVPKRVGSQDEDGEMVLSDVINSSSVTQYDFGSQYPDGFRIKDGATFDKLGNAARDVQSLLRRLSIPQERIRLDKKAAEFLEVLQENADAVTLERGRQSLKYRHPGSSEDKLFPASYHHQHRAPIAPCVGCRDGRICPGAAKMSCNEVGCDERILIRERHRLLFKKLWEEMDIKIAQRPAVHLGGIASADTVMKSGIDRDEMAKNLGLWQCFAAARAASTIKALLALRTGPERNVQAASLMELTEISAQREFLVEKSELMIENARLEGENRVLQDTIELLKSQVSSLQICLQGQLNSSVPMQSVLIIDARGDELPFCIQTITSKPLFMHILKDRFADTGTGKIERGNWYLEDRDNKRIIDLTKPWATIMKPGRKFHMGMVFRTHRQSPRQSCPSCRSVNAGEADKEITCHKCGLVYCRIDEIRKVVVQGDNDPEVNMIGHKGDVPSQENLLQSSNISLDLDFARPRAPKRTRPLDEELGQYKRIRLVDTSFYITENTNTQSSSRQRPAIGLQLYHLRDLDLLTSYLSQICGLSEEECITALKNYRYRLHGSGSPLTYVYLALVDMEQRLDGHRPACYNCHMWATG
ncbi:hypothetical protein QBC38DRAFT_456383 [Podospora fimiseda]|uniref:Nucleoside phosphorylase domain-containing protein n=1 Tax=Podospora fimiseda TaxID=252190 RepID=A0AAN7BMZ7_9PEZI|nr:hypothetical protein QBC38DRAFT_456383 [Podospora fimiseda]